MIGNILPNFVDCPRRTTAIGEWVCLCHLLRIAGYRDSESSHHLRLPTPPG